MFQATIATTPYPFRRGFMTEMFRTPDPTRTVSFGSREERETFVQRDDVWWYCYAEEDKWVRGGAWKQAEPEVPVVELECQAGEEDVGEVEDRW